MSEPPFRPISDKTHFPILSVCKEQPYRFLMCCDDLAFLAPEEIDVTQAAIQKAGNDWHLYGDIRWPSRSVWIEFPLTHGDFSGHAGVLVLNTKIPTDKSDAFAWVAKNHPLQQILIEERGEAVIQKRLEMLRTQSTSTEYVPGPEDIRPKYVQSYCIFQSDDQSEVRFIAAFTDLLNAAGLPIQKYRMATALPDDVFFCRFALYTLFGLNEARRSGRAFLEVHQFQTFGPVSLLPGQKDPKWAQFHPSRTLRTRPALRALPSPTDMKDGLMQMADFQRMMEIRRQEMNAHMLPFDRMVRPREEGHALQQNDSNSSAAAFSHRANGGAIYVLPNRLVEEFDNTDCGEVNVRDIILPFPDIFLRFTPSQPIFLANGAPVDGCYVVRQTDEFLFILTSHLEGVDYQRSLSMACIDPTFSLHLPATNGEMSINLAVEHGIEEFVKSNAPPERDESETIERPDGTVTHLIDIRAKSRRRRIEVFRSQEPVFRACLNIVINAACFISFKPDDISEAWEGEPSSDLIEAANDPGISRRGRDKKREALRKIETGDYTRIKICGRDLFSDTAEQATEGRGPSPRAHWRRGHWRRQRHGTGLSLVILRWIRPTIVMKDTGPVVEARIYDVQKPPS